MSTRHLVTRTRKLTFVQYNSNSAKSAVSQHISSCQSCQNCNLGDRLLKVTVLEITVTMKMKPKTGGIKKS